MNKIKFAVIGQGHIGKRHAEMIRRSEQCELIALCDNLTPQELGLNNVKENFYHSVSEMLNSHPEIEVVNICTPNGLHATHSLKALAAGKHIVVEKPMALNTADCEKIIYKALQMSKQVFCVMQNRYSPPSVWLKQIIENKIIGENFMVQLNCYWNRDERYYKANSWKGSPDLDGGTLFTQFSHFIDILYWLFGDITNIQGKFSDFTHKHLTAFEDSGFVSFSFVNGGMGCINYSTAVWDTNLESSMTIIGSNGSIKIGGQYMDKVEYCHIKNYTMPELPPTNPANDYGAYKGSANNHGYVIENVLNTLLGKTTITTNALEGLKVVDIIQRIYSIKNTNFRK
ncbi:MAG: Gfo/Idh/MocA family oxidoreductase [Bacteroidetes bacterium]|nr:gfo/Idh/MocA family oxidoreductase [Bacteroidota bacterium]MBV6462236.1 Inositol 2-dehydrogenase/D-chiro-inositol 3-dehydrogenase [Flavobacteriales bacterium]WKZ74820.1 MAG: Gfo/Idh/MocA family oxidoreductase [Vicingaceae bacterium]MCL4816042.1 Gfo/Idh/MocA family oxidoreductase [Flavobacteriales bacterium]NOG95201.1 Gfo/Idh/MocA family oxidoreductase [Bacteroidota bacterium]